MPPPFSALVYRYLLYNMVQHDMVIQKTIAGSAADSAASWCGAFFAPPAVSPPEEGAVGCSTSADSAAGGAAVLVARRCVADI